MPRSAALLGTDAIVGWLPPLGVPRKVRGVREIRRVAMVSHRHDLAAPQVAP